MTNKEKRDRDSLESSIKILAEITMSDLQSSESKSSNNNANIRETFSKTDDWHPFFDWNSWTFVKKKII